MPRKVFTAGEILTAANLNDVSDQSVMVFDDATDRATAIPTPVEGMVTYLEDVGGAQGLEVFDGAVFTPVAIVPDPPGLIAVKSAIFTGTQVVSSVAAKANFAVTDLSITHEVADASNKLIISAFIGAAANTDLRGNVGLAIHDGTGLIAIGASPGERTALTVGGAQTSTNSSSTAVAVAATFVHTPGAGSKTYTVRAFNVDTTDSQTVFINRSQDDSNGGFSTRAVSSLVIQEVSV